MQIGMTGGLMKQRGRMIACLVRRLALCLLTLGLTVRPGSAAADAVMQLNVVNLSGFPDDQVYFMMICQEPLGYLDFRTRSLVEMPSFALDTAKMTATLAQLRAYSDDGTGTIICPAMGSSRVYFAYGRNFDQMGGFVQSGPIHGYTTPVPWAMFEVNLRDGGFINQSYVDSFCLAYTLTVNPRTGGTRTVGITTPASTIFEQFEAIPDAAHSAQRYGNPKVFKSLIVRDDDDRVVRVLAPKSPGLDLVSSHPDLPQMFTHFLDDYVNRHCWRPNRTFSFSSKLADDPATYYGRISADGLTLSIHTDAARTVPYAAVPTLPRPSNAWGHPDFANNPGYWHNVGKTSVVPENIDWGYLLYGQDGWTEGPGAHWISDPVAMAIPVSIVRGVMHLDNGTTAWKDARKYYQGLNGVSTAEYPIFQYAKILHAHGLAGQVYALSFDDVYGTDSSISFTDPNVTLRLYPFDAPPALGPCIRANGRRGTLRVGPTEPVALNVTMHAGQYAGTPVDWWVVAIPDYGGVWYGLNSGLQWEPFPANALSACRPVHSGLLADIAVPVTVLPSRTLPRGTYRIYFAVDYPMDGILHYPGGQMLHDVVTVVVH